MSRFHSYLSTSIKILNSYDGSKPFMFHLKSFFSQEKKYGSRDRKLIASLCYGYFRTGHALKNCSGEEKVLAGLFLTENDSNEMLSFLNKKLDEQVSLAITQKLALLRIDPQHIFPFHKHIGNGIEAQQFILSFFNQPHLYLRIRPGKQRNVIDKLNVEKISFRLLDENCLELANNTAADKLLKINSQVIIQDRNSQKTLDFLKEQPGYFSADARITTWDCCAASGGKSILLYDILEGNIRLTVSDIRDNILFNLSRRLQVAGINIYRKFTADLTFADRLASEDLFSIILCDAPCTGSGTWARTPEQLFYFAPDSIKLYADRQKKIVSNIVPHLKEKGLLFYITCSVFKEENEDVVEYIQEKFHLELLQMKYLKGYEIKADTLFVAVFNN